MINRQKKKFKGCEWEGSEGFSLEIYFPHLPISTIFVPGAYTLFPTRAPTATQMAIRMATLGIRSHPANYYPKLPQICVFLSLLNALATDQFFLMSLLYQSNPSRRSDDMPNLQVMSCSHMARESRYFVDFGHHPRLSPSHLVRPASLNFFASAHPPVFRAYTQTSATSEESSIQPDTKHRCRIENDGSYLGYSDSTDNYNFIEFPL